MSLFGGKRGDAEPESPTAPTGSGSGRGAAQRRGEAELQAARVRPTGNVAMGRDDAMANIGKSIAIKGDLTGQEDLVIEGKVEGKVDLPQNELTIGANGQVQADVHAKNVLVVGKVAGNVSATERVEIQSTGVVDGDVRAPRLVVQEGARLNGSIHMEDKAGASRPGAPAPPPPKMAAAGGEGKG